MTAMRNFIEEYLSDPARAISDARIDADRRFAYAESDEDLIYREISTSEFRLYEEVILTEEVEKITRVRGLVSVA